MSRSFQDQTVHRRKISHPVRVTALSQARVHYNPYDMFSVNHNHEGHHHGRLNPPNGPRRAEKGLVFIHYLLRSYTINQLPKIYCPCRVMYLHHTTSFFVLSPVPPHPFCELTYDLIFKLNFNSQKILSVLFQFLHVTEKKVLIFIIIINYYASVTVRGVVPVRWLRFGKLLIFIANNLINIIKLPARYFSNSIRPIQPSN